MLLKPKQYIIFYFLLRQHMYYFDTSIFSKKWIKWSNSEDVPSFLKFFQNQFSQLFSTQQLAWICTIDSKMCMAMVYHGNSIFREWGWTTPSVRKKHFFFFYNNCIQQYSRRFSYGYLFKRIQFFVDGF